MGDISRREAIGYSAGGILGLGVLLSDTARDFAYRTLDAILRPSAAHAQEPNKFDALYGEKRTFKDAKEELGYLVQNFYMKPMLEVADETLGKIRQLIDKKSEQLSYQEKPNGKIDRQYTQAVNLRRKGQYDDAIALLKDCLQISPTESKVYEELGLIFAKTKSWKQSREMYKEAIKLDPQIAANYLFVGKIATIDKQWTDAYFHLKVYEILNPDGAKKANVSGLLSKISPNMNSD